MRFDSIGLLWHDKPSEGRRDTVRPIPPTPDTGWRCPHEFPRLEAADIISLDIETHDPELRTKGPGVRRDGYIVGIAVGTLDGGRWYFPMRHSMGNNMNPDAVLRWARNELCRARQKKIGANLMYDLDYLWAADVPVCGDIIDVLVAEPLIDENQYRYNLDGLAVKYLDEHKVGSELYEWSALAYGGQPTAKDQGGNIWRCPVELVGPYAKGDVDLPLRIWEKQRYIIQQEGLDDLLSMENALTYPILKMRQRGTRVDSARADELNDIMLDKEGLAQARLNEFAGTRVDVWSGDSLARVYKKLGIWHPMTAPSKRFPKGQASFTKGWLEQQEDVLSLGILDVRKWSKNRGTFVEGYIKNYAIDGRIHALFHQLKSDDGGTVSGRFSSSNPNLQNIPARDPELGPLIRSLFIPEEGCRWRRYDWSQIEYRFLAHYARGAGAIDVVRAYLDDPNTDYHVKTHGMILDKTNMDIGRKPTKNVNFGLAYGMGIESLAALLGVDIETATAIVEAYHSALPFVKSTFNYAARMAKRRGYVKTVLGRKARFPDWEPASWDQRGEVSRDRDYIEDNYGAAIRAGSHKALNRVLQGSSADLMKRAFLDAHNAGIFDVTGYPHTIVHDEFNFSDDETPQATEAFNEMQYIMENCIKIKVPIKAEPDVGPNWGNLEPLR